MSTTLVTITGDVSDALGVDFNAAQTKIYARYNTDVVGTDDGYRLGSGSVRPEADGTFTLEDVVAATSAVENLQVTIVADYVDRVARAHTEATFGPYDLSGESGTVDLRDLDAVQYLDASRASVLMDELAAGIATAQAAVADAVDISGIATPDGVVEALVAGTGGAGPLTRAALSASIDAAVVPAVTSRGLGGRSVICAGDSIIAQDDDFTGPDFSTGNSIPQWAALSSSGRMYHQTNAGVGGDTSTQLLARFAADVVDLAPDVAVIGIGTNDARTNVSLATFSANIEAMVALCRAAGILPVLMTVPPTGAAGVGGVTETQAKTAVSKYNAWLNNYASTERIALCDRYAVLADTSDDIATANDFGDQVHLSTAGSKAVGVALWATLAGVLPGVPADLARGAGDPTDLLNGQGLFLADTAGLGTGWSKSTDAVATMQTDGAVPGRMQRIAAPGTHGWQEYAYKAVTVTAGHVLELSGVVTQAAVSGHLGLIEVNFKNVSDATVGTWDVFKTSLAVTRGTFVRRMTVPATCTYLQLYIFAGSTAGSLDVGQLRMRDLTALGLI